MNEIDAVKARLKFKKHNSNDYDKNRKYINNLITRLIVSLIVFFAVLILTNFNSKAKEYIKDDVLKNNISFTKVSNFYNKYFGNVLPIKDVGSTTQMVFNEDILFNDIKNYKEGFEFSVNENYIVPVLNSGIVAFIGEKEGYGKTVIIEGIDEIEYWYGNLDNISVSLYDYVSKKALLGNTVNNKLYMVFKKNGEFLDYEEVIE